MRDERGGVRPQSDGPRRKWRRGLFWVGSIVALAMLLPASSAVAESEADDGELPRWSLAAATGVQELASRDEMGSPLMYGGVGFPAVLQLQRRGPKWTAGGQMSAQIGGLNGGQLEAGPAEEGRPGHRADGVSVDLSVWMQRLLADPGDHRVSVGGGIGHWTFFRSYLYDPAQIGSVESWDASVTADLRIHLERRIGRLSWHLGTNLALAGRMMRPSHSLRGDEQLAMARDYTRVLREGNWATIGQLQKLEADAGILWDVTSRWGAGVDYRARYLSYRGERPTRAFAQRLVVGAEFRF